MLELSIQDHASDCLKKKLKNVCRTRWAEQNLNEGWMILEMIFFSFVFWLESRSFNKGRVCDKETSAKTSSFYKLIACLTLLELWFSERSILHLTFHVTELLQGKEIDMADASYLLDFLKTIILSKRSIVDEFHNNWYRIILNIVKW